MAQANQAAQPRQHDRTHAEPSYGLERVAPLDGETVARALLTHCLDGADALMHATVLGAGSAMDVLRWLRSIPRSWSGERLDRGPSMRPVRLLEEAFGTGLNRWGRRVDAKAIQAFLRSLAAWHQRSMTIPKLDENGTIDWLTADSSQWIIAPHSPYWPASIQDLATHSTWATPLCLWGRGNPCALVSCDEPVSIVGSRGVNRYGHDSAHQLSYAVAIRGHTVVSGGAMGTDAAAHWGAVAARRELGDEAGPTIAVFAGGLSHIGPTANMRLFDSIVGTGGALISELCPPTIPHARRFLLRNRIIAALAHTVVVCQARLRSGAINTANWAADLNRVLYAIPGTIDSPCNAGCNRLIHDGKAILLHRVDRSDELCHAQHLPHRPIVHSDGDADPPHTSCMTAHDEQAGPPPSTPTDRQPTQDATMTSPTRPLPSDEQDAYAAVRRAIRACHAQSIPASLDAVLAHIRTQYTPLHDQQTTPSAQSAPTMADLLRTVGMMELEGRLSLEHGQLTEPRKRQDVIPATDSAPDRRARRPHRACLTRQEGT